MPFYMVECGAAWDDGFDDSDGYVSDDYQRSLMMVEFEEYGYRRADTVFRVVGRVA